MINTDVRNMPAVRAQDLLHHLMVQFTLGANSSRNVTELLHLQLR